MPMRKRIGKIIQGILLVLLVPLLLINLWQAAARAVFHQETPYLFGYAALTVLSGSMEPAFSAGDLLVIHKESEYAEEDIVAYRDDEGLTTHRIIEKGPRGFTTKGDYNNAPDLGPVLPEQIAGRVVLVIPALGRVLLFLRTPAGLLALLAAGLLLLLLPAGWRRLQNREKRGAV